MGTRTIQVSTSVFAEIWSNRLDGEDDEDAILARLLHVQRSAEETDPAPGSEAGFQDQRYGVHFPEGFKLVRTFQDVPYEVEARGGKWRLSSNGYSYDSLSSVGDVIKTGIENVWQSWYFVDDSGERQPIASLRDPAKVARRGR